MLQSYLEMLLYDGAETALVTLAVLLAAALIAFWLRRRSHRRALRVLLGLAALCPVLAAVFWYGAGGLGGGIFAMTLCLFGLPALAGLLLGGLLAAAWPRIRRHKAAAAVLCVLLLLAANWACPRRLTAAKWNNFRPETVFVSDNVTSYRSWVLVTQDGGQSWQPAQVRSADPVNAAIGSIRCGPPVFAFHPLPDDLPDEQLLLSLDDRFLLLITKSGPSYVLNAGIALPTADWHLLLEHGRLAELTLSRSGTRSRVLAYPALYNEIAVWLTAPA